MRWLLVKDLQILKRSPLLVGLLIVYPIAIALMIGFALSSPPGKPKVAFYNEVPTGQGTITLRQPEDQHLASTPSSCSSRSTRSRSQLARRGDREGPQRRGRWRR